MSAITLVCRRSGAVYDGAAPIWRSEAGGLLDVRFEARFPRERIAARAPSMWRYREALPIENDRSITSLGEPLTPLVEADVLGRRLLLKLDHLFPTGSYKDRGAAVLISRARELGVRRVVEDSSGNAGAAIAAYAARAGIRAEIFVPEANTPAKLAQIRSYGTTLRPIPGPRAASADAAMAAAERTYYASHVWNPFFFHGTKTFAYEIVEQLGWQAPDGVIVPTGNGTLLIGAYIGLRDLVGAGVIPRIPPLFAVQAATCAPLLESPPPPGPTLAEGIAIADPPRAAQCREILRETGGAVLAVTDAEIVAALRATCASGFFIEPTSAAAIAAAARADLPGRVVTAVTGHGLKAAATIARCLAAGG